MNPAIPATRCARRRAGVRRFVETLREAHLSNNT